MKNATTRFEIGTANWARATAFYSGTTCFGVVPREL